jgi:peptidoglycan-N-acetylglucosamine deacetylase
MLASISLDLDNKWSYMKTHGDPGWESFPSYLDLLVPRVLDLLDELKLKITFFIVGQDAAIESNHKVLCQIPVRGHEVGNHSFHHEPWLHLYDRQQVIDEFESSERSIRQATGETPRGFRGPGFSYSPTVLSVLRERKYVYDCSTFPTFLGPLARMYYFLHSGLGRSERDKRKQLFGEWNAGFQRLRPYWWHRNGTERAASRNRDAGDLLEIPVTTMPWFKVPIHLSYVMYLATYSKMIAKSYFYNAMRFCWINRVQPSLLLHPLDFLGCDDESDLSFFPGMSLKADNKLDVAKDVLGWMSRKYQCVTMLEHAEAIGRAA